MNTTNQNFKSDFRDSIRIHSHPGRFDRKQRCVASKAVLFDRLHRIRIKLRGEIPLRTADDEVNVKINKLASAMKRRLHAPLKKSLEGNVHRSHVKAET